MAHQQSSPKNTSLAISIGLTLLILFGYVLASAIWQHGTKLIPMDSFIYLRTGFHLASGDGLGIIHYYPDTDSRQFVPTTHYPPLIPLVYSVLALGLNIHPDTLPTIVSLVGWIAMLAGIGVFTYQLSKSPLIAALTVILPATSYGTWFAFLHAMSEPLFLPLLIWLMVLTYNLPQREYGYRIRFVGVVLVLMLLMLTRYVGVVVLAAVMLWWAWHWWYTLHRKLTTLIQDSVLLAASAIPAFAIIMYHKLQATPTLGGHLAQGEATFADGVWAMLLQGGQILLPNLHMTTLIARFGNVIWIVYLLLLLLIGWLLGNVRGKTRSWMKPHPTPALLFLVGYVLLYTVVQPFFSFEPIDWRDMTSILCLTIPLISAAIAYLPVRWSSVALTGYIGLNSLFSIGHGMIATPIDTAYQQESSPIALEHQQRSSPTPLEDRGQEEQQEQDIVGGESGLQKWITIETPRSRNLPNYHPDLLQWVQAQSEKSVILTNVPELLAPYADGSIEHAAESRAGFLAQAPQAWLDAGSCRSKYPVSIVLFPWDKYAEEAQTIQQAVERKCPGLPKRQFEHSVVYTLH